MIKRIALLICNSNYTYLSELQTPINNGEKLESILTELGNYDQITFKKDLTVSEIKRNISDILRGADDDDEILIYFSGHGCHINATELVLAGIDTPKDDPAIASVEKSFIFQKIQESSGKQFLFIIDSCFSGGMIKIPEHIPSTKKIEILTSAKPIEYAFEPTGESNFLYSYFTLLFIDAIEKGIAGKISMEYILAKEIFEFAFKNYSKITSTTPQYKPLSNGLDSFKVVKNPFFDINAKSDSIEKDAVSEYGIEYLDWLIRELSYLKLHGIHSAHNFKGVALENIYVALRGEKSSSYEKVKAKTLSQDHATYFGHGNHELSEEELYDLQIDSLQDSPVMLSILERDKIPSEYDIPITIGEAFRDERFLIILGDPGSGKTTLAQWLSIQLARTFKEVLETGISKDVVLPESKVDPYIEFDNVSYNLGPSRLPILLSIADYAQFFSDSYPKKEISIIEYIGMHKWRGKSPSYANDEEISPIKLQRVFEYFLKKGEVVVILDGMDEVTKYRKEIVSQIENFISKWIINKGDNKMPLNFDIDWRNYSLQKPGITGGNQVVITSRIVGYHLSPITKSITHVTIEPMKKKAIGRFCDMWMDELHRVEYGGKFPQDVVLERAKERAASLKNAIFSDKQILELATNPLLITIIALVYRNNDGHLPSHRAALYQEALITLIETWKQPGLSVNEVIYVLSEVAQIIHTKYPKGIIKEAELISIIEKNLAQYRGLDINYLPANFNEKTVEPFINEIRNKVGIIAPRGDKAYGFIHQTFQEYLTARYLTKDKYKTSENIVEYLDSPRWKVPLIMALGDISVNEDWDSEWFAKVLDAILESDSKLSKIFPRSALLLSSAFAEISLEKVDEVIIKKVIFSLLEFYFGQETISRFPELKRRIEKGFVSIKQSEKGEIIEHVFYDLLTNPPKKHIHLVPVAVNILHENRWFSKKIVQALYEAIKYDSGEWNWIINRTLIKLVSNQMSIPKPVEPERPDSPKTKFEKAIEKHRLDLEKLETGELRIETEIIIKELEAEMPIINLKEKISVRDQLNKLLNDEINENYNLIEKILDYSFEKELIKAKGSIGDFIIRLEKDEKGKSIKHLYLSNIEVIDRVLLKIKNDEVNVEINKKIEKIINYVNKNKKDYEDLLQDLKDKVPTETFIQLQKDLSKIKLKPSKNLLYSYPSFEDLSEGIDKTMYLCHILLNIVDYNVYLGKIETDFTENLNRKKQELKFLNERLENIQNKAEKNIILNQINEIREKIKGEHFSTAEYKEEWKKYNFSYQYYEDVLEKYQEQERYPFEAYNFAFQSKASTSLSSFRDYYLFTLFWGGFKISSQIEVWNEYDETAAFLQKSDGERDFIIQNNPHKFYGKYGYNDVIHTAAFCLDTNVIKLDDFRILSKQFKNSLNPFFLNNLIYRKPTLSTEIIGQANNTQALSFIISQSVNQNEIVDATILKAFTQSNSKDAINIIACSKFEKEIVEKLKATQATLENPIFDSFPLIFKELEKLANTLSADEWFEIYQQLYSTLLKARKSAYITKDLLEIAPEKYKSVILADHWYTTSTILQDDKVYEFAVMLDTCVKESWSNRIKNAFLEVPIAPTFCNRNYLTEKRDWAVFNYISSDIFREDELPIDVLSTLENYNLFSNVRSDLTKAFQESYLNMLVTTFIKSDHSQKPELFLFCLQNSFFENGLEKFLPHNLRSINYLQNELLPQIISESDNYYKSRAFIRFLPYARNQEKILLKLIDCFNKIIDPFEKAQVYLLIKQKNIFSNTYEIDDIFSKIIFEIQNPLQKIKVIVDGYSFISNFDSKENLHDVLFQSLKEIENVDLKGRIANLLINSEVNISFKNKVKEWLWNSDNNRIYNIGLNLFGLNLLLDGSELKVQKQFPEHWTPILLFGAIDDIVNYFSPPETEQSITGLWNNLMETPSSVSTVPLLQRGIKEGLELTPKVVEVIDFFLSKGNIELLTPLFPILQCTNGNVILSIEKWMNSPNGDLRNYASLYHAEFYTIISPENIDGLLTLRLSTDSRIYCRTNIVLSQGITGVKRHIPRKYGLLEFLELSFIEKISENLNIEKNYSAKKSLLNLFLADLELDSFDLIQTFLQKENLKVIFEYSNDLPENVEEELATFIASDIFNADEMLESIVHIVVQNYCEHIENKQRIYIKIHESLLQYHLESLKLYKFIPKNVFSLIDAYQKTHEKTINNVKSIVENEKVGLDKILQATNQAADEMIESGLLRAYGYHYHKDYIFKNYKEIIRIKELYSDDIYEFFIRWFLDEVEIPKKNKLDLDNTLDLILILISIWTDEKNLSILNSFNIDGILYESLLKSNKKTKASGTFSCVNILKFINQHSKNGIEILLQKINSSPHIQIAAIQTLNSIKNIDENSLDGILNGILISDPLSSSIYVSILSNYANDSNTKSDIRKWIVTSLIDCLNDERSKRGIYHYSHINGSIDYPIKVQYVGRLDEVIFKAIIGIVDI